MPDPAAWPVPGTPAPFPWPRGPPGSAATFQQERRLRRLVVLAGRGPIDRGFGIPDRAAKETGGKVATVHVDVGGDPAKAFAEPVADYVIGGR